MNILKICFDYNKETFQDHVCLINFHLDVGNVKDVLNDKNRFKYLAKLKNPYVYKNKITWQSVERDIGFAMGMIQEAIDFNKDIHIYLQKNAENICGFLFVMSCLKDYTGCIQVKNIDEHNDVWYTIDLQEKICFANRWNELIEDNGVLRVYENGKIINKKECYYDALILEMLSDKSLLQRDLNYIFRDKNIPVLFANNRINTMIKEGKIQVLENSDLYHERVITSKNI